MLQYKNKIMLRMFTIGVILNISAAGVFGAENITFRPESGFAGKEIEISGANFNTTTPTKNVVKFGDKPATVKYVSKDRLIVDVPDISESANITVAIDEGAPIASNKKFVVEKCRINGFVQTSGAPGDIVSFKGSGFARKLEDNAVIFEKDKKSLVKSVDSQGEFITVEIPEGAVTGKIKVNDATSEKDFVVENKHQPKPNIWNSTFALGIQELPNYNDKGENEGLKKSRPFGKLNIDTRWESDTGSFINIPGKVFDVGADVMFLGTAQIKSKTETTPSQGDSSSSTGTSGGANTGVAQSIPSKFSEISDTVDASVYFQAVPQSWQFIKGSEVGWIARVGLQTLDVLDNDDKNSLNNYLQLGLKYSYYGNPPNVNDHIYVEYPQAYIDISYQRIDRYAGVHGASRCVVDAQLKLVNNWYLGLHTNAGRGPDEFYVTLSTVNSISTLAKLLGIDTEKEAKTGEVQGSVAPK